MLMINGKWEVSSQLNLPQLLGRFSLYVFSGNLHGDDWSGVSECFSSRALCSRFHLLPALFALIVSSCVMFGWISCLSCVVCLSVHLFCSFSVCSLAAFWVQSPVAQTNPPVWVLFCTPAAISFFPSCASDPDVELVPVSSSMSSNRLEAELTPEMCSSRPQ